MWLLASWTGMVSVGRTTNYCRPMHNLNGLQTQCAPSPLIAKGMRDG